MNKPLLLFAALLMLAACKKEEQQEGCPSGSVDNPHKAVVFWADRDLGHVRRTLVKVVNTTTGETAYDGQSDMSGVFASAPDCTTPGSASVSLRKGYSYRYTINAASGATLGDTVSVPCDEISCQPFLVQP